LTTGQWGQATVSGFAVFTAGLCLASTVEAEEREPAEQPEKPRKARGRGIFAQSIGGGRK